MPDGKKADSWCVPVQQPFTMLLFQNGFIISLLKVKQSHQKISLSLFLCLNWDLNLNVRKGNKWVEFSNTLGWDHRVLFNYIEKESSSYSRLFSEISCSFHKLQLHQKRCKDKLSSNIIKNIVGLPYCISNKLKMKTIQQHIFTNGIANGEW